MAGDRALLGTHLHHVEAGLVLVQAVQHDLEQWRLGKLKSRPSEADLLNILAFDDLKNNIK